MKKMICLLLAVSLLASVSVVMADEADDVQVAKGFELITTPEIPYGAMLPEAMEKIETSFDLSKVQFSGTPVQSTRTLSNGKQYQELAMSGTGVNDSYQLEAKYYFTDEGMTIAGTQEYIVTDAIDISNAGLMLNRSLGTPEVLDLNTLGDYAELIGEEVHLENGQNIWHYTTNLPVTGEEGFVTDSIPITVYVTLKVVDNHMYLAEFMNPPTLSQKVGTPSSLDAKGFDQLTPEEQQAVSLYAEYLEAQKQAQLEQYIEFLLRKH